MLRAGMKEYQHLKVFRSLFEWELYYFCSFCKHMTYFFKIVSGFDIVYSYSFLTLYTKTAFVNGYKYIFLRLYFVSCLRNWGRKYSDTLTFKRSAPEVFTGIKSYGGSSQFGVFICNRGEVNNEAIQEINNIPTTLWLLFISVTSIHIKIVTRDLRFNLMPVVKTTMNEENA